MPIIKSAKKRVRTARKATVRNAKTKRTLKTALKSFGRKPTAASHAAAQSNVDKAVKKGLVHKNKANRMKKQLAAKSKSAGVKPAASTKKSTPANKPAAKKSAAKKAPAKKSAKK